MGANPHSIGTGYRLFMVIDVTTTATAGGAAVVTFEIITATAGREPIAVAINPDIGNQQGHNQRFMGMRFNVTTGPLTAGNFTAGFQLDFQDARVFPASTST